jgi:hypothetical protein
MVQAGLQNHTDQELYLLESFVGRKPPFRLGEYNYGGGGLGNDR